VGRGRFELSTNGLKLRRTFQQLQHVTPIYFYGDPALWLSFNQRVANQFYGGVIPSFYSGPDLIPA